MSEPMTSGEIEDVLASIRRLVSQDLRPRRPDPEPEPPPTAAEVAPAPEATKLILTPALRIVHPFPAETAPEAGDTPDAGRDDGPAEGPMQQPGETAWLSPAEAEGEAADLAGDTGQPAAAETGADTDAAAGDAWADDRDAAPEAEAWTEAPSEPSAATRAEVYPDAGAEERTDGSAPMTESADLTDLDLFDAEALRDLVRDVLREELQGPLGERITRNIRKLVRAEIARALAAQDLD